MYTADENRYSSAHFRRCGDSGILLPAISLGLWHNFGERDDYLNAREMVFNSFDHGITHFDLANNYGPPYGAAELTFARIMKDGLDAYRDEIIISTKAGWDMWPGPYGDHGSKKYLISSLEQSLKRLNVDYVDIFYHHRPDLDTPLEETAGALLQIHAQGKALYLGISQYDSKRTREMARLLSNEGVQLFIHQPRYNLFDRWIEDSLLSTLKEIGTGAIVFSPLDQGILTSKYLEGIPAESRAAKDGRYLKVTDIQNRQIRKVSALNDLAVDRGQTLAQMAVCWILRHPQVSSALVGASRFEQIKELMDGLEQPVLTSDELKTIDKILKTG